MNAHSPSTFCIPGHN